MFNYKKIAVIGCSGAGKSTFSKKLAGITNLPLHYLDLMYWKEDGTHIGKRKLLKKQKEIFRNDEWIIDGNFRATLKYRIKEAELIFFFDLPTQTCINGVLGRGEREDMPCVLPVEDEFIDYIKNFNTDCRPIIYDLFKKYPDTKVITFHSHKDVDDFVNALNEGN